MNGGGICWWCYWGWPKAIADIYDRAEADIDALLPTLGPENNWTEWAGEPTCGESALKFGPTHCVWEDENFGNVDWELEHCNSPEFADWHPGAMEIVKRSLLELKALPDEVRSSPPDYDGENPANFPPCDYHKPMVPR